jgi:mRNA deadenylase 3'-5' endonuclease subunit Ccr4
VNIDIGKPVFESFLTVVDSWKLLRNNVALFVLLHHLPSGKPLLVANTHLYWNPSYEYVKFVQCGYLLEQIEAFLSQHQTALTAVANNATTNDSTKTEDSKSVASNNSATTAKQTHSTVSAESKSAANALTANSAPNTSEKQDNSDDANLNLAPAFDTRPFVKLSVQDRPELAIVSLDEIVVAQKQAKLILEAAASNRIPVIVCGDFNSTPHGYE